MLNFAKIAVISLLLIVSGMGYYALAGETTTETRAVKNFNRVTFACTGELFITQGNEESLSIEADSEILSLISTEVRNGALIIQMKKKLWKPILKGSKSTRFNLKIKEIEALNLSGSGEVHAEELRSGNLELEISGSGDIVIEKLTANELDASIYGSGDFTLNRIQAEEVEVIITGSGDAKLVGEVQRLDVSITGSGDVSAANLSSRNVEVAINGSGDVMVRAAENLEVEIYGSGDVSYYGNPKISRSISGSGDLIRLSD
ncbi:MAG: head GIN domain-containing protein [bacterium]